MKVEPILQFSTWKQKDSLADFTKEELRECERIAFIYFTLENEEFSTVEVMNAESSNGTSPTELDMYLNFSRLANPYSFYETYKHFKEVKKEFINKYEKYCQQREMS